MNPTLLILALSSAAAGAAALGILPLLAQRDLPDTWLGRANALAAGMMLGASYLLTRVDAAESAIPAAVGAILGAAFILSTHLAAGTGNLELNQPRQDDPSYGYRILLTNGLHSSSEGVAIGLAMAMDPGLGVFMAAAIALHNIPEATVMCSVLRRRGVATAHAAGLAVAANTGLILLAVTTYSVVVAAPKVLPWATGFAIGALVQLVLMELLPESYRQAGQTSIAVVTVVALGVVVLAQGFVP